MRRDGWTIELIRNFVAELSYGVSITEACEIHDVSRTAYYAFRERSVIFRQSTDHALQIGQTVRDNDNSVASMTRYIDDR